MPLSKSDQEDYELKRQEIRQIIKDGGPLDYVTDAILSKVAIVASDQKWPENPYTHAEPLTVMSAHKQMGYAEAQDRARAANFRRVVTREK